MADEATSPAPETACERAMARYRKALGKHWQPADEMLFRGAWNEGAAERDEQMCAELEQLRDVLALVTDYATRDAADLVGAETYAGGVREAKYAIRVLLARAAARREPR